MERRLFSSMMSIATALVILVSSFILWQNFNNEEGKLIAESYGELPLSMRDNNYDTILYGDYIDKQDIVIDYKNLNDIKREEKFYLIVHTDSTIDELGLTLTINDKEYKISDFKSEIKDQYRCYLIEELNFNEYEDKKLNIKFKKNNNISNHSYLVYDFQII